MDTMDNINNNKKVDLYEYTELYIVIKEFREFLEPQFDYPDWWVTTTIFEAYASKEEAEKEAAELNAAEEKRCHDNDIEYDKVGGYSYHVCVREIH